MKVTACMMVKNEEKLLPQALGSLQDVVDEIVVVDTGSTDQTVEIAEMFGARVYHSPWRNDFSYHRNEAFKYADDADWWLVLDADEKINKVPNFTKALFKEWLGQLPEEYLAIAIPVIDKQGGKMAMNCNSARLFRKGKVYYQRKVHNQPVFEGACVLNPFIGIEHFGYDLTPDEMKLKFNRTKNLLFEQLKDDPEDYDVYFYLCQLYGHHGYAEQCRKWGEKYLEVKNKIPSNKFNFTIYFTMIKSYQENKEFEKAQNLLTEALRERAYDPDLCMSLSDQGAMTDNPGLMAEGARRFLRGYIEMAENPAKKGGQFYFSLRDEAVTINLYRLCVASLEEGMRAWTNLKPRLKNADNGLLGELKNNFNIIGCSHLIQESPELSEKNLSNLMDIRQVVM